ncbi:MAG: prepilin-type N-terminal cleavage/methylation domain-containing protein [Candidatus Moranbacteria bacterium]|nr:prepilin-type N-terminal cleavage/methylation domain-containing protein [Candidatus Moranbacteria bacterium]
MKILNFKLKICKQRGFSVVEAVVASAVFAILVTGFTSLLMFSYKTDRSSGDRNRATFLAEEGIEISRAIRDKDFLNLSDGTHGTTDSSGVWSFSGSSDGIDKFTRQIEISTINDDTKKIISNVSWSEGVIDREVILTAYLTNWREVVALQGDNLNVDYSEVTWSVDEKDLLGITLENIGDSDIVIDKMIVSWSGSQRIEMIEIDGVEVWAHNGAGSPNGKQDSGIEIDIVDVTISPGGVIDVDKIAFSKKMIGETVDIIFIMADGTQKEVTGINP